MKSTKRKTVGKHQMIYHIYFKLDNLPDRNLRLIFILYIPDQKRNRSITLIRWDLIKEFIKSKNLVLAHHILIPALGIPVSYNANFKLGDFLFAVGFLMEASTPFVCMRRILDILGKTKR